MRVGAGKPETRVQHGVEGGTRSAGPILPARVRRFLLCYGSLSGLAIIIIGFGILRPSFLTVGNFVMMLRQLPVVALLALGVTLVLVVGGLDLSVTGVPGVAGSLVAILLGRGYSTVLAVSCGLAVGLLFGLINGIVVTRLRIGIYLSGLAISWIARGIDVMITRYEPLFKGVRDNPSFLWLGRGMVGPIPTQALIVGVVFIGAHIVMTRTRMGRNVYAVGGSPDGAAAAGLNPDRYRLIVLAVSGLFAATAGILAASRQGAAIPLAGQGIWADAVLAAVFGTTVLTGGVPHVLGTAVGAVFTGVLLNGLTQLAVNQFYQDVIKGALLVAAVGLTAIGGKVLKVELK